MSIENARAFYEKVKVDQGLQQKIGQLAEKDPKAIEAIIIKTAKENGFEFTAKEMSAFAEAQAKNANHNGELSDSDLDAVAGGKIGDWVAASVLSGGLFCAVSAAAREAGGCNLDN